MSATADDRVLPNPEEPGISVHERVARITMSLNHWLHPDYTDRELRMLDDLGGLVGFARDVLPILERAGVHYTSMRDHLTRIVADFGPWNES